MYFIAGPQSYGDNIDLNIIIYTYVSVRIVQLQDCICIFQECDRY